MERTMVKKFYGGCPDRERRLRLAAYPKSVLILALLLLLFSGRVQAREAELLLRPQSGDGLCVPGICLAAERAAAADGTLTETFAQTGADVNRKDAAALLAAGAGNAADTLWVLTDAEGEGRLEAPEDGWYLITMASKNWSMEPFLVRIPDETGSRRVIACPKVITEEKEDRNESQDGTLAAEKADGAYGSGLSSGTQPVKTLDPTLLGNAWLLAGISGVTVLLLLRGRK